MFRTIMIMILWALVASTFAIEPVTTALIISSIISAISGGISAGVSASSASKDRQVNADQLAQAYSQQRKSMGLEYLKNKKLQSLQRIEERDALSDLVAADSSNQSSLADSFIAQTFR